MKKTIVIDRYEFQSYMNMITDNSKLSELVREVKDYLTQTRDDQVVITMETQ